MKANSETEMKDQAATADAASAVEFTFSERFFN